MQNSVTFKNSNLLNECNYKIWKIKLSAGQLNIYNMSSIWKKNNLKITRVIGQVSNLLQ